MLKKIFLSLICMAFYHLMQGQDTTVIRFIQEKIKLNETIADPKASYFASLSDMQALQADMEAKILAAISS